jgi:pimeloyl-ACP methyl ester carboxylesterase
MKSITMSLSFTILLAMLGLQNYAQNNNTYPFEVKISGKGSQSIIFIPGFGCSADVWNETKIDYEKNYACYVLTMAGFAGAKPTENPSFLNWESGIAAFIVENKIKKPIIIGHSMGGGLALAIAADYPDLLSKIIVVDALPCLSAISNPSFKSKENNDCSGMVNHITTMSAEEFLQMQKMSMPQLLADSSKQDLIISWSVKSDKKTFAQMFCDFLNTDLRVKITNIKCPALILLEPSFLSFKSVVNEQYKNLKTANFQYATKGLHFIMYDDKDWYDNQLKTFINLSF